MLGATVLSLADKRDELGGGGGVGWTEVAVGFVVAFVVAVLVIKAFVAYVSRRGFAPFAWYRIAVGAAAIAWLALR
jgi:undecaprenyl-diphosphatase